MEIALLVSPLGPVSAANTLTLTLIACNNSSQRATGMTIGVPVPYGTSALEGSLYHDAVRVSGDAFFGDGCDIAELEPGARTAFVWKLRVEGGNEPIRIVPHVFAGVTPVTGAEPLVLARSAPLRDAAQAYGEFERTARAYFQELFAQPAPASLQQALFACALACALDAQAKDTMLERQAQALHRLAHAVRGHHVTGVDPAFLMELRGLREAHVAAATIEGLRAFAALDVAARNLAANDRVGDSIPFV